MKSLSEIPTALLIEQMYPNIKTILFDMDGTLLNSEILHARALHALLERMEHLDLAVSDLLDKFKGVAEPDVVRMLVEMQVLPQQTSMTDFIDQKNHLFESFLRDESIKKEMIAPGMLSLLDELKRKNYVLALVTASERNTTELFINSLNLSHYFEFMLTRDDTEKTKPDPMPYLHSFARLKVEASQVLILEDSPTGLQAAVASGAHVQKVAWYE